MPRRELRMPETGLHLYGTPCRPTRISRRRFFICALVAALPPHIAVTEALTLAFMFGIIRHNYFSVNIVLEIARFRFYTCTVENEDGQRLEQRIISHRRLNGCIGDFLYLKSLNNEYKLDIQQ